MTSYIYSELYDSSFELRVENIKFFLYLYSHYENNNEYNMKNMNSERHIIQSIKNKLQSNIALITKADKGNTESVHRQGHKNTKQATSNKTNNNNISLRKS
jgi:hypothetical protein